MYKLYFIRLTFKHDQTACSYPSTEEEKQLMWHASIIRKLLYKAQRKKGKPLV